MVQASICFCFYTRDRWIVVQCRPKFSITRSPTPVPGTNEAPTWSSFRITCRYSSKSLIDTPIRKQTSLTRHQGFTTTHILESKIPSRTFRFATLCTQHHNPPPSPSPKPSLRQFRQENISVKMAPSNLPSVMNATSQDIETLLAAQCHLGSKNLQVHMENYLWKTRADGVNVINVGKTWYV